MENLGKTVGKLFLFILFLPLFVCGNVKLHVYDTAGHPLQQAGIGEPFILEVEIIDDANSTQVPIIVGLDRFSAKRTGLYMRTVNGKSMAKYSYQVRIDQPGFYEIGPAVVTNHKKKQSSSIVTVTVGDQTIAEKTIAKKKEQVQKKEFLRLFVDNNKVVVGQKVICTLRFYYNNGSIELKQIGRPEIHGGEIKNIQGPQNGRELIDNVEYKYAEWQWDLYPTRPGKLIIPAYNIDFDVQSQPRQVVGSFSLLFGLRAERKRIYSNAAHVQVDSLPPYDGSVQAVGNFKTMEAYIKPAMVKEGEAMVMTIDLEGDGDLEKIELSELTNLPKQLKYYKSNNTIIQPTGKTELPKKKFEFIIQGINCGEWEIPSQSFTYFDVQNYSYKTLKTVPLTVSIAPSAVSNNVLPSVPIKHKKGENKQLLNENIYPINQQGSWYLQRQKKPLQWVLFGILVSIPICIQLFQLLWVLLSNYWFRGRLVWWEKKKTFRIARKQLKNAIKDQEIGKIYHIFIVLIANCCSKNNRIPLSATCIKQQLEKKELPENLIVMWDNFFIRATEYAFMSNKKSKFSSAVFLKQAEQWLNRFEELEW